MRDKTTSTARRVLDCVTEVRMGNTVLTVSGYFKQDGTDTAADKMMQVLRTEGIIAENSQVEKTFMSKTRL